MSQYAMATHPRDVCHECFTEFKPKSVRNKFCQTTCKDKFCSRQYRARNEDKLKRAKKDYDRKKPYIRKNSVLKMRYGITLDFLESEKERLDNRCTICRQEKRLVVDHCHTTGKYRGLLCDSCNTGIGKLGDNVEGLQKALNYLKGEIL